MSERLFTYGTLSPESSEAAERDGWVPDAVRGRLFDLGPYPGLVEVDDPVAGWVSGYVREVELAVLEGPLDAYEETAGGLFRRVQVNTRAGLRVWVYVYGGVIPPERRTPIDRWRGRRVDASVPEELKPFW